MLPLELHLKLAGMLLILLGLSHVFFAQRFQWKEELERLSLLNRQIFYVHAFFIALIVVLFGALALFYTETLIEKTALARVVLGGILIFWTCRLWIQFFGYDASLWKGDRFNTVVHVLFSLLWTYFIGVFGWVLWRQF